jgi:hypothetical protein
MIFAPTKPEKVMEHQLYEARRLLLEHEAAAEYHKAMAEMCRGRIERLNDRKDSK